MPIRRYLVLLHNGIYCRISTKKIQLTKFTNPTMCLSHIPLGTIHNRNVHIFVLNGALWDLMCQLSCQCRGYAAPLRTHSSLWISPERSCWWLSNQNCAFSIANIYNLCAFLKVLSGNECIDSKVKVIIFFAFSFCYNFISCFCWLLHQCGHTEYVTPVDFF